MTTETPPTLSYAPFHASPRRNWLMISIGLFIVGISAALLFLSAVLLFLIPVLAGFAAIGLGVKARISTGHSLWKTRSTRFAMAVLLVGTVPPFALVWWASRPGLPVKFVMPTGYRGMVELIIDPVDGRELTPKGGIYTIEVPEGGILRVKDQRDLFRRYHSWAAVYADETPIPDGLTAGLNTVAFRPGGWRTSSAGGAGENHVFWVVGTQPDVDLARR